MRPGTRAKNKGLGVFHEPSERVLLVPTESQIFSDCRKLSLECVGMASPAPCAVMIPPCPALPPTKEFWAIARVHKRQSAPSAERNLARQCLQDQR